jgi:glycosyltransferase involved in cell wall biosynthesis
MMRMTMRLLFLIAYPGIHGPLPKLAPLLIRGLRDCGLDVEVQHWSRHRENETLAEKLLGRAGDVWRVRAHLKARPVDAMLVTTSHNWPALIRDIPLVLLTSRLVPVTVLQFHGSRSDLLGKPGHRVLTSVSTWLARHASAVLLLSHEEVDEWRPWAGSTPLYLVRNPFVPPALPADPADPGVDDGAQEGVLPIALFVGRLEASKGVFDLLEAFAEAFRREPFVLVLAGHGDAAAVRDAAHRLGIADAVELTGYLSGDAIYRAYAAADLFVLPSHREGFPTVVLEAMAFGLPVVTTRIRGAADVLVDGENGLLVDVGDTARLAEALVCLVRDPQVRSSMGERNKVAVRDFAPEAVAPRYAALLHSLSREQGEAS